MSLSDSSAWALRNTGLDYSVVAMHVLRRFPCKLEEFIVPRKVKGRWRSLSYVRSFLMDIVWASDVDLWFIPHLYILITNGSGLESGFGRDDDPCIFKNDSRKLSEKSEPSSMEVGVFWASLASGKTGGDALRNNGQLWICITIKREKNIMWQNNIRGRASNCGRRPFLVLDTVVEWVCSIHVRDLQE